MASDAPTSSEPESPSSPSSSQSSRSSSPSDESARPRTRPRRSRARKRRTNENADERHSSADPVRVYLRDMGQVSLLTREGEVEIAKRIEAGIHDQELAILGNPFGLAKVLELAAALEDGEAELDQILDGLDDDGAPSSEERRRHLDAGPRQLHRALARRRHDRIPLLLRSRLGIARPNTDARTLQPPRHAAHLE